MFPVQAHSDGFFLSIDSKQHHLYFQDSSGVFCYRDRPTSKKKNYLFLEKNASNRFGCSEDLKKRKKKFVS